MELVLIVITVVSMMLAVCMGLAAWRLTHAERVRSAARVAALAADLHDVGRVRGREAVVLGNEPVRFHPVARRSIELDNLALRAVLPPAPAGEMFHAGVAGPARSRLATVLAVGSFAVATALALVIATSRGGPSIAETLTVQSAPARPADPTPLELVALTHEREGDRITIRGIVRNPSGALTVDQLTTVVYLFDRGGAFLGDGQAAIDVPALTAGTQSAFVVAADQAANVGRYRVSFKIGDRVVPHIDRRNSPASTTSTTRETQP